IIAAAGKVDILVNNAGITKDGLLLRMKEEEWDAVLDTNLKGAFLCMKAAAKVMTKARHGRIVNISSVVGEMGNPGQVNYCASKAGMFGMTKSAARELAKRNVTVNAVAPGFIETDMTAVLPEKAREALLQEIPLERLGAPEDVANAVWFLVSPLADYVTGQVLSVNGGMYM
ncbi:MAG TPA: 3-oxoacyl-ACP reductase FabG, partial [Desulfuromonadaceae bacterium]